MFFLSAEDTAGSFLGKTQVLGGLLAQSLAVHSRTFRMNGGLPRATARRPVNAAIQPSPGEGLSLRLGTKGPSLSFSHVWLHPIQRKAGVRLIRGRAEAVSVVRRNPRGKLQLPTQNQCLSPTAVQIPPDGWGGRLHHLGNGQWEATRSEPKQRLGLSESL